MTKYLFTLISFLAFQIALAQQHIDITKFEDVPSSITEMNCIVADSNNVIWVGTNNGLLRIEDDSITHFYDPDDPTKFTINCMTIDSVNVLWLGTYKSSIIKFDNGIKSEEISFTDKLNDEYQLVTGITVRSDNVWIATSEGAIVGYSVKDDNCDVINTPFQSDIYSIFVDNTGEKWICTPTGLYYTSKKNKFLFNKDKTIKWKQIKDFSVAYQVYFDGKEHWVVGRDESNETILMFYDYYQLLIFGFNVKIRKWSKMIIDAISDNYSALNDLDFDSKGDIWLALSNGIILFMPEKNHSEIFDDTHYNKGFDVNSIKQIAIVNDASIWVITQNALIYKMVFR